MTFIIEDGTGLSTANAYEAVAFADSYFADRGITAWTGSSTVKEQAIVKATDYVDTKFGASFRGIPLVSDQALAFPRADLLDAQGNAIEGIPEKFKKAVAEYALRALTASLLPDPTVDESGMRLKSKKEVVGPIEESLEYSGGGAIYTFKPYPAADKLLQEYLVNAGGSIRA